jgi:hypothetical protein
LQVIQRGGGLGVELRRTFLNAGLSFLALAGVLGVCWLAVGWRPLAVAGGVSAGIGSMLALVGVYVRWQGWE